MLLKAKEGEYLTPEQVRKFCLRKCKKHDVEFDYCCTRMLKMKFETVRQFVDAFDDLLFWAYWNDYDNLFPHRKEFRKGLDHG